jgi:hypothetical protein
MMAKILCHGVYQKADIFKIVPTADNIEEEYVLYLSSCVICDRPVLEIHRIDTLGKILEPVRLKTKNIPKFLDSMTVLWKPVKLRSIAIPFSRFSLNYNEYGKRKKCYQNLYSLELGKIDTDPYKNLKHYKAASLYH